MTFNKLAVALAFAGLATSAHATNGYFSHGYGMTAKGMGGAATAMAEDTFGGANNPASMVWVGNRLDVGVDVFSPRRSFQSDGGEGGTWDVDSEDKYFLIPEFGYNRMLDAKMSLGVTVYGNGGMNSDYPNAAPYFGGSGDLGVDLMQLIIAPTLAYKLNDQHSIGVSALLGAQRFAAQGLQGFGVMNPGYDTSYGFGARVGWMGKLSDKVTIGAAYATKMHMSELDKYDGLFAEQGDFDIPSNWNIGVAIQATPQVKVAADFQRINYSDVKSINNPSANIGYCMMDPVTYSSYCFGGENGPGFGWDDVNVWKLGVEYVYSNNLTLRAGYNHGDNPISPADVTFNILAPGVVQNHLTLGFTYTTASGGELTMAYMHAFENDVTGSNLMQTGNTETIKMYQNAIGIAYGIKM